MQIKRIPFSPERQTHFLQYSKGIMLILSMVVLSLMVGNREVILAGTRRALSIGTLVYMKAEWRSKPWDLFKLPTLTAMIGFLVNQFDIPMVIKLVLVFLGMMIVLAAAKNFLAPALATGLLPVTTIARHGIFSRHCGVHLHTRFLYPRASAPGNLASAR